MDFFVTVDFAVGVRVAGKNTMVPVGLAVGRDICVAGPACVEVEAGICGVWETGMRVGTTAPGVRKKSIQTGWVKIAGSRGGTRFSAGRVR